MPPPVHEVSHATVDGDRASEPGTDAVASTSTESTTRRSLHRFLTRSRQTVTFRGDSKGENGAFTAASHTPESGGRPADSELVLGDDLVQYSHPSERKMLPTRSTIHRQASAQSLKSNAISDTDSEQENVEERPEWQAITELVRTPRHEGGNPVYGWHNTFVSVRHRCRAQMQVRCSGQIHRQGA